MGLCETYTPINMLQRIISCSNWMTWNNISTSAIVKQVGQSEFHIQDMICRIIHRKSMESKQHHWPRPRQQQSPLNPHLVTVSPQGPTKGLAQTKFAHQFDHHNMISPGWYLQDSKYTKPQFYQQNLKGETSAANQCSMETKWEWVLINQTRWLHC